MRHTSKSNDVKYVVQWYSYNSTKDTFNHPENIQEHFLRHNFAPCTWKGPWSRRTGRKDGKAPLIVWENVKEIYLSRDGSGKKTNGIKK